MLQPFLSPAASPRLPILDALRGIAALLVVAYHIMEVHGLNPADLIIAHGNLAVDFFFALSGFVIAHAYDRRRSTMSAKNFLLRRLIRLHPMVVFGTLLGAALFYFGASQLFPLIEQTPIWKLLLYTILGILLIPMPPSADIRGWREMYTLDAPAWSLFYEYIANLLYACFVRHFSTKLLRRLVILFACATIYLAVFVKGDIILGWEFSPQHLHGGFTRLLYPFFAGLFLYRIMKWRSFKFAFPLCAALLLAVFFVPRLGGEQQLWLNGLYESIVILFVFPFIVYCGACGSVSGKAARLCHLLGGISYPVYLINYPIIYIYTAYISDHSISLRASVPLMLLVFAIVCLTACMAWKYYDMPLQKYLKRRLLKDN